MVGAINAWSLVDVLKVRPLLGQVLYFPSCFNWPNSKYYHKTHIKNGLQRIRGESNPPTRKIL